MSKPTKQSWVFPPRFACNVKVDIVSAYYDRHDYWPLVVSGLENNADRINRVICVYDGPWPDDRRPTSDKLKFVFLNSEEHIGPGAPAVLVNKAYNEAVESEYVFQIPDDVVMESGCLDAFCEMADPELLVVGALDYLPPLAKIDRRLPLVHQSRVGDYQKRFNVANALGRGWKFARSGFTLLNTQAHFDIGGQSEEFRSGYGYEEQEYGVRWALNFGNDSILCLPAMGYHISVPEGKNPWPNLYEPNLELLVKSAVKLYGGRFTRSWRNEVPNRDCLNLFLEDQEKAMRILGEPYDISVTTQMLLNGLREFDA